MMRIFTAEQTRAALTPEKLIPAIEQMFVQGCTVPLRHHHSFPVGGEKDGTLLLMPAWQTGRYMGVKLVNVVPGNSCRGRPALSSIYILSDASSGSHLALIDGNELTSRRTASASALAARYLARRDADNLLVIGAGRVARLLPDAHRLVRPIRNVAVWDISRDLATDMAVQLCEAGFNAYLAEDLSAAVHAADIVSCATLSTTPLVHGEWVRSGTHLDLIGSFTPEMREVADSVVVKSSIFVDTEAATKESGDLVQPLDKGAISSADILGSLAELCAKVHAGRQNEEEITLFKSVGTALEDLAAAALVYESS